MGDKDIYFDKDVYVDKDVDLPAGTLVGGDLLIWGLDKWLFRRVRSCDGRQVDSDEWHGAKKIIFETSRL